MKVKIGKGVMSKDGKTPYAAGTLHFTRNTGWKSPADLSFYNIGVLLKDDSVLEIQIIDEKNRQITITKDRTPAQQKRDAAIKAKTEAEIRGSIPEIPK